MQKVKVNLKNVRTTRLEKFHFLEIDRDLCEVALTNAKPEFGFPLDPMTDQWSLEETLEESKTQKMLLAICDGAPLQPLQRYLEAVVPVWIDAKVWLKPYESEIKEDLEAVNDNLWGGPFHPDAYHEYLNIKPSYYDINEARKELIGEVVKKYVKMVDALPEDVLVDLDDVMTAIREMADKIVDLAYAPDDRDDYDFDE